MLYTERKELIMKQLTLKSVVGITDLAKEFQVSLDTIRRDLKNMEQEGLLKCVRGGACLPDASTQFSNFKGREIIHADLKKEAVKKAISFIHNGDVIMMNSGTTNTLLAQELAASQIECSVVTNNIAAVSVLSTKTSIRTIVLGGALDAMECSTYGSQCETELNTYYPDICFLSVNALHLQHGFTDFRLNEITIMQQMLKRSKQTYAVMDSSKLNTTSKRIAFSVNSVSAVIMDNHISQVEIARYAQAGILIK